MKNEEFIKLKNSIARKSVIKILLYSLGAIILFSVLIDGVYNDELADSLASVNRDIYYWCVANKIILLGITYLVIFAIISFFVIRNTSNNMVEIIKAMDQIIKEPEKEVKLSNDLILLESKLNNIRVDLVSNQNKAKEALQKKNDLIMYMAHDLKTPLTSIIGYLTLLTDEKEIPENLQKKYMDIALKKSLRLEELTNQFFDITRYNLQSMLITKQNIDLVFLLEQLVEESYPMLQEKKLECILNKPKAIQFMGDGDKLARAFGNLLKNAINYSYLNTTIKIDIKEYEDKIEIVFKNKGDKIPEYKLEKIFDKFYRADESRTSSTGGAGLGLAITKQIIELHNGKIYAKNDNEFIEFYIELSKWGKNEKEKIYYFNILEDRKNNTEKYQEIVSILGDNLQRDDEGNLKVFVPNVSFVVNGKIIGNDYETSLDTKGFEKPSDYWTEEEVSELENTLSGYMKEVYKALYSCTDCNK